jgi:hypothetical protein
MKPVSQSIGWPIAVGALAVASVLAWTNTGINPEIAMRNEVREQLLDPDSAIFTNVRRVPDGWCGYVRARNRFGGMAPSKGFFVHEIGSIRIVKWSDAEFSDAHRRDYRDHCQTSGT